VEKLRRVLNKITNACDSDLHSLDRVVKSARKPLQDALAIEQLTKEAILKSVNSKRAAIGLPVLGELASGTSISDGIEKSWGEVRAKTVPKVQAAKDIESLKEALAKLNADDVEVDELAGEQILKIETSAQSGGSLGGIKVSTNNAWFAARPSGTEDVYKIYGESFKGEQHLEQVLRQAQLLVDEAVSSK
jgi:phosphomannomutase